MSCINQDFKNYEIIILDTSDKKNNTNYKKLASKKKISYFHIRSKYKQPEKNQMHKVLLGFKKSKGRFICLMDGDDYFNKKKLSHLNKLTNKKAIFFNQDNPTLIKNNLILKEKIKRKRYKDNLLFNSFINSWPQIYGTSSILVKKNVLEKFFKKAKPFNWKYIAIDAQLAIFCKINFKITNIYEKITNKIIHDKNLGLEYHLLKKKFWARRYMQHKYYSFIKKENIFTLDFIFTAIIYFILRNL